jgi:hypothetical protein
MARQRRGQTVRPLQPQEGIMSTVDSYHAEIYKDTDPIDWACFLAATAMDTMLTVYFTRTVKPAAFPSYFLELSPAACGRQIVGRLMDAGWTPPPPTPSESA